MTKSQRIEYASTVVLLSSLLGWLLRPEWQWMDETAFVAFFIGMSWANRVRTPEDRERTRKNSWLLPAVALAMAVQWVYFSGPEQRLRTSLLGAGLVLAATALAWKRRTSAP